MEIRLLKAGYKKNEDFYKDFLEDKIKDKEEYFSDEVVNIDLAPDFPIYMGVGYEANRKELFLKAFDIVGENYLGLDRDIYFDEVFWHSLLCVYKREYLLEAYPQIEKEEKYFRNIVIRDFDWENYIYKIILGAQYVNDNLVDPDDRIKYYNLIIDNLDLFNYIIKYEIFRNDKFLINILTIIDELDLSKTMKAKIKGRDDLGNDERIGRRVIFEFNKSYPVIMSPMMEKEELKEVFLEYLSYYSPEE